MAIVAKTTMVVELVDKVSSKLKTMREESKKTENELTRFSHRFMQVFRALLAFVIIRTVTVQVTNFFKSLIQVNSELELLQKRLALLVGGKNIEGYVKSIRDLTIHTPFVVQDLMNATDALEAFGINAKDNLKVIADWSSGTGIAINDLAIRFAKIAAGSPRIKLLLNTAYLSVQRYREELRNTGNTVDALRNTIEASFPDMARESSKTFKGMMTNISDITHFIEMYLGKGLFIVLRRFIGQLYDYLNNLLLTQSQKMVEIGNIFAANVVTIVKRFLAFATAIGDITSTIVESMGGIKNSIVLLAASFLILSKSVRLTTLSFLKYLVVISVLPSLIDDVKGSVSDLGKSYSETFGQAKRESDALIARILKIPEANDKTVKSNLSIKKQLKIEAKYWIAVKDAIAGNNKGIADYLKWYRKLTPEEQKATRVRKDAIQAFSALLGSFPTKNLKNQADDIKKYTKEIEDALKNLEKRSDIKKYVSGIQAYTANIRAMLSVSYLKKYGEKFSEIILQHAYTLKQARADVLDKIKELEAAEKTTNVVFDTSAIALLANLLKQIDNEQKHLGTSTSKLWSNFQASVKALKAEKEYYDAIYAINDKRIKQEAEGLGITLKTKATILDILLPELESLSTTEQKKKALIDIIELLKKYGFIQVQTVNQLIDEYNSYKAMNKIFPNMFDISKKYLELRDKIKKRIRGERTELEKIKDILALLNLNAQKLIDPIKEQFNHIKQLITMRKIGYDVSKKEIDAQKEKLLLMYEQALAGAKNRKEMELLINLYSTLFDNTTNKQAKLTEKMLDKLIIRITNAKMYLIKTGFQALNQFFTDFFDFLISNFGKVSKDWKKQMDDMWQHFKAAVIKALSEVMAAEVTKEFIKTFFPKDKTKGEIKPQLGDTLKAQILKWISESGGGGTGGAVPAVPAKPAVPSVPPAAPAAGAATSLGTIATILAAIAANLTIIYQLERYVGHGKGPVHDVYKWFKNALGFQSGFEGWITSPKLVKVAETSPEYVRVGRNEETKSFSLIFNAPIYGMNDFSEKVVRSSEEFKRRTL